MHHCHLHQGGYNPWRLLAYLDFWKLSRKCFYSIERLYFRSPNTSSCRGFYEEAYLMTCITASCSSPYRYWWIDRVIALANAPVRELVKTAKNNNFGGESQCNSGSMTCRTGLCSDFQNWNWFSERFSQSIK